jgi:predicted metal-dependent enzyme (double-stranded beta helix superfamily)
MSVRPTAQVDHLAVARQLADCSHAWPVQPRFDADQRWYHRLVEKAGYEAWLLTWLPGQGTELHDHGGSAGAFVVVSGALTEASVTGQVGRQHLIDSTLPAGSGRRFGAHHVHQITNNGPAPAVSLHVYGPALTTMTRYRLDGGRLEQAALDLAGVAW